LTVQGPASVRVGTQAAFTATLTDGSKPAVQWAVNGTNGGDATIGTVDASGQYTAPATLPTTPSVTLRATVVSSPTVNASMTVQLLNPVPVISAVNPVRQSDGSVTFTITGTNFVTGAVGIVREAQVTGGSLTAPNTVVVTAPAASVSGMTAVHVAVRNPDPGAVESQDVLVNLPAATPAPQDITAVNHVVMMMQENRSFDSYLGMLNPYRAANGFKTCVDGPNFCVDGIDDKLTTFKNVDDEFIQCATGDTACQAAHTYFPFKLASTCVEDMTSSWVESYGDVNRFNFTATRPIKMDGFIHTAEGFSKRAFHNDGTPFFDMSGSRAMGYYDQDYLNYYYFMASSFAISDRWFSPVSSKTVPNRIATFSGGTTEGYVYDPGAGNDKIGQSLTAKTIFQALDEKGVSWRLYYSETESGGFPSTTFSYFSYAANFLRRNPDGTIFVDSAHIAPIAQFTTDAQNGTLPQFAFLQASGSDEHPGAQQSILSGQQQVAGLVNALMASPSWKDTVFFFTYDEGGGPLEHVPPVPHHTNDFTTPTLPITTDISSIAVNADSFNPCPASSKPPMAPNHCDLHSAAVFGGTFDDPGVNANDAAFQQGFAAQLGFRTPNLIISPFSKSGYVGHTPMDHTAILHFVETRFGLQPLTMRDAAQPDLLEYFDFVNVPWKTPPTPPAPTNHGQFDASCTPDKMR
jgi:phospholipase C